MKVMNVAAGVFRKDDKILLMRRAPNEKFAGEWEYPGGKFEIGETGEDCLKRELKEELCIDATVGDFITKVTLNFPDYEFNLFAYCVDGYAEEINLTVHDKMEWVPIQKLNLHPQLQADKFVSEKIVENFHFPTGQIDLNPV